MLNNFLAWLFPVNYRIYIESEAWRRKASAARKRAGYRCQRCHANARLDVHHKTYARLGYELPKDLIALCRPCHETEHL
jgi:5-methylcytosine-specific restriction endonuclease McrA